MGVLLALTLAFLAAPPVPGREVSATGPAAAAIDPPKSLLEAQRLSEQLRYEEAIVEYERYLADPNRPTTERAQALLAVGFLHLVLGDDLSARRRTLEALELAPDAPLPSGAPARQAAFVEQLRKDLAARTQLEVLRRGETDRPEQVRARLTDPQGRVKRVLLRHGLSPKGPFYGSAMRCQAGACEGEIPPPRDATDFTAYYFLEALDKDGGTLAEAASPTEPLQLSVVGRGTWYKNPWVWGAGGAALVAVAGVVFLLSPPPPK